MNIPKISLAKFCSNYIPTGLYVSWQAWLTRTQVSEMRTAGSVFRAHASFRLTRTTWDATH